MVGSGRLIAPGRWIAWPPTATIEWWTDESRSTTTVPNVRLGPEPLTIEQVVQVARDGAQVEVADQVRAQMAPSLGGRRRALSKTDAPSTA